MHINSFFVVTLMTIGIRGGSDGCLPSYKLLKNTTSPTSGDTHIIDPPTGSGFLCILEDYPRTWYSTAPSIWHIIRVRLLVRLVPGDDMVTWRRSCPL